MSFKLFVYYCAVCGASFGFLGWLLGRLVAPGSPEDTGAFVRTVLRGLSLGAMVAFGLGMLDALWNSSARQVVKVFARGLFVAAVGCLGGLLGAAVGQVLYSRSGLDWLVPCGWLLTGLLIGASVGAYDVVARAARGESAGGATKKVRNGLLGGAAGGLLGGLLYIALGVALSRVFARPAEDVYSSSAWGFVALGACIGLFVGLAQIILKEAWVRVEAGFRPGRELILTKERTLIGRAEGSDIGLYGDPAIARQHARIVYKGRRYLLEVVDEAAEAFVNDERVTQPRALRSGDLIRVGKNLLRFGERQKRK